MKHLITYGLIGLFAFVGTATFAYEPTDADESLIQSIEQKVERIAERNPEKLIKISTKIERVLKIIPTDTRASYMITKMYEIIQTELGTETTDVESMIDSLLATSDEKHMKRNEMKKKALEKRNNNSDDDDSDDDDSDDDDSDDDDSDDDDSDDDDSDDDDSDDDDSDDDDSDDDDSDDDDSDDTTQA